MLLSLKPSYMRIQISGYTSGVTYLRSQECLLTSKWFGTSAPGVQVAMANLLSKEEEGFLLAIAKRQTQH